MKIPEHILRAIMKSYGSLTEPNFAFVSREIDNDKWGTEINFLMKKYLMEETTSLNTDCSRVFRFFINNKLFSLMISLIGPFAACCRQYGKGDPFISLNRADLRSYEKELLTLLSKMGFEILDRKVLEIPIDLKLFYTSPEEVFLFQALFSDSEGIPYLY